MTNPHEHSRALCLTLTVAVACSDPSPSTTREPRAPGLILFYNSEVRDPEVQKAVNVANDVLGSPGFERQAKRFAWKNFAQSDKCKIEDLHDVDPGQALADLREYKSFDVRPGRMVYASAKTDAYNSVIRIRASRLKSELGCAPDEVRSDLVNTITHESLHLILTGGCYKYLDTGTGLEEEDKRLLASYRAGDLAECFLKAASTDPSCASNWRECGVGHNSHSVDALVDKCVDEVTDTIQCLKVR